MPDCQPSAGRTPRIVLEKPQRTLPLGLRKSYRQRLAPAHSAPSGEAGSVATRLARPPHQYALPSCPPCSLAQPTVCTGRAASRLGARRSQPDKNFPLEAKNATKAELGTEWAIPGHLWRRVRHPSCAPPITRRQRRLGLGLADGAAARHRTRAQLPAGDRAARPSAEKKCPPARDFARPPRFHFHAAADTDRCAESSSSAKLRATQKPRRGDQPRWSAPSAGDIADGAVPGLSPAKRAAAAGSILRPRCSGAASAPGAPDPGFAARAGTGALRRAAAS